MPFVIVTVMRRNMYVITITQDPFSQKNVIPRLGLFFLVNSFYHKILADV